MRCPLPATALALAAIAVGCGKEDEPLRSVTVKAGEVIRVKGDEYAFDPGRIVVKGSAPKLEITLVNAGRLAHNLEVTDGERTLGGLRSFPAGEERTLEVRVPPGSYEMVCTVADHEELGMKGELEVVAAP